MKCKHLLFYFFVALFSVIGTMRGWAQSLTHVWNPDDLQAGDKIALQCRDNNGSGYFFKGAAVKSSAFYADQNVWVLETAEAPEGQAGKWFYLKRESDNIYMKQKASNTVEETENVADAEKFKISAASPTGALNNMANTDVDKMLRFTNTSGNHLNARDYNVVPTYANGTGGYSVWYVYKYNEAGTPNVSDTYFRLVSSYANFYTNQSVSKAMYNENAGSIAKWKTRIDSDINQIWIKTEENGAVYLQNAGTRRYFSADNAVWAHAVPMGWEKTAVVLAQRNGGTDYGIKVQGVEWDLHAGGHSSGNGTNGDVVFYNDANTGSQSSWYLEPLRADEVADYQPAINAAEAPAAQRKLNEEYAALKADAQTVVNYVKSTEDDIITPVGDWLITDVSQISSPKTDPQQGSLANLLVDNYTDFWHSDWHNAGDVNLHYLQFDLGAKYSTVELMYGVRQDAETNYVTAFEISASNEVNGTYNLVQTITNVPSTKGVDHKWIVKLGAEYQYVRVWRKSTNSNSVFWHASKMNFKNCTVETGTQLYTKAGTKATDLETILATEVTNATQEQVDDLRTKLATLRSFINNSQVFTIKGERGVLCSKDTDADRGFITKAELSEYDANNANQRWALIEKDGTTYLYNLGAQAFGVRLTFGGPVIGLSKYAVSPATKGSTSNTTYPYSLSLDGHLINISDAYAHQVMAGYETLDPGNRFTVKAVGVMTSEELNVAQAMIDNALTLTPLTIAQYELAEENNTYFSRIPYGTGLGQYSYTGSNTDAAAEYSAVVAIATGMQENPATLDKTQFDNAVSALRSHITINIPTPNRFYTFKGGRDGYLSSMSTDENDNHLVTDKREGAGTDPSSFWLLLDDENPNDNAFFLVNYAECRYATGDNLAPAGNISNRLTIEFGESRVSNNKDGKYSIKPSNKNYWCNWQTSDEYGNLDVNYINHWESGTDIGCAWTIEEVDLQLLPNFSVDDIAAVTESQYIPNVLEGNNTVQNLVLTDGVAFSLPQGVNSLNATSATYTRTMANEWGTLCLPYAITNTDDAVEYYDITSLEDGVLTVTKIEEDVPAGKPVLVRKKSGESITSLGSGNVTTAISGASAVNMHGTYAPIKINEGTTEDNYVIAQNKFWLVNSEVNVAPFRAYFSVARSLSAGANAFSIAIADDDLTAIGALTGEGSEQIEAIYTVDGKKVSTLQPGLNIIRLSNGKTKKIIIK